MSRRRFGRGRGRRVPEPHASGLVGAPGRTRVSSEDQQQQVTHSVWSECFEKGRERSRTSQRSRALFLQAQMLCLPVPFGEKQESKTLSGETIVLVDLPLREYHICMVLLPPVKSISPPIRKVSTDTLQSWLLKVTKLFQTTHSQIFAVKP